MIILSFSPTRILLELLLRRRPSRRLAMYPFHKSWLQFQYTQIQRMMTCNWSQNDVEILTVIYDCKITAMMIFESAASQFVEIWQGKIDKNDSSSFLLHRMSVSFSRSYVFQVRVFIPCLQTHVWLADFFDISGNGTHKKTQIWLIAFFYVFELMFLV